VILFRVYSTLIPLFTGSTLFSKIFKIQKIWFIERLKWGGIGGRWRPSRMESNNIYLNIFTTAEYRSLKVTLER
jgi:hypothetical protein